jgi:hypothetical protein
MYFQRKKQEKDNSIPVVMKFRSLELEKRITSLGHTNTDSVAYRWTSQSAAPRNRSLLGHLYCAKLNIIKHYATMLEQRRPC